MLSTWLVALRQLQELTVLPILVVILLQCTQTITRTVDVTPPSITCPATLALGCNATVPAADVTTVTASDACGTPTVTFVSDVVNLAGCTETTTRTYRATDPCGNTAVMHTNYYKDCGCNTTIHYLSCYSCSWLQCNCTGC
jgi:hypothetical protein